MHAQTFPVSAGKSRIDLPPVLSVNISIDYRKFGHRMNHEALARARLH